MSYNKKFRKVVEQGGDIVSYIGGTILGILGLVFAWIGLENNPIMFGSLLTIVVSIIVFGWIDYFNRLEVYWEEIK